MLHVTTTEAVAAAGNVAPDTLVLGDCLDVLKHIPSDSVDMVLADPPYGTTRCKWDSIIPLEPLWVELKRVIKRNGLVVMTAQTPFDKVLGASNLKMLKYEWIWEKSHATGHLNAKKMPMKAHENVLVFYSKPPTYNFQKTQGHKPANLNTAVSDDKCPVYGKTKVGLKKGGNTDRYPRSVIRFPSDKQRTKLHPTQKPLALMEYFVKTYTNEGDLVLDFAMGSGTVSLACQNLGRQSIGIELDADHFEVARTRLVETHG